MTGILKDVLSEHADDVAAPAVDLAAITRAGDRRIRRRRAALAGGVAAAAVAAVLAGSALLPGSDPGRTDSHIAVDGSDASPLPLSWATGSTVHRAGLPDIELPGDVHSWLWAGQSIAWVDMDRTVHVWIDDEDRVIGQAVPMDYDDTQTAIVSDDQRVGWLDTEDGFVVHDLTTGGQVTLPWSAPQGGRVSLLSAIDGSTAYGVDARGVFAWDLESSKVRVIDSDPRTYVLDAEAGTLLRKIDGRGVVSGPGRDATFPLDSFANLSPDGSVVTAESNDEGILVDTTTGARIEYDTGRDWSMPFHWLDDHRVAVLAMDVVQGDASTREENVGLTTCDVTTGKCDPASEALAFPFSFPLGVHFDN